MLPKKKTSTCPSNLLTNIKILDMNSLSYVEFCIYLLGHIPHITLRNYLSEKVSSKYSQLIQNRLADQNSDLSTQKASGNK